MREHKNLCNIVDFVQNIGPVIAFSIRNHYYVTDWGTYHRERNNEGMVALSNNGHTKTLKLQLLLL